MNDATDDRHSEETAEWKPQFGLRNRHVQSLFASVKLRRPMMAKRAQEVLDRAQPYIFDCAEGGKIHGLLSCREDKPRKLAVLIHGWEGCADSLYILSLAAHLYNAGYDIFRLHLRDHGPTHHLTEELFHANRLDEVCEALNKMQTQLEPEQWYLAGFSLGGNFALRVATKVQEFGLKLSKVAAISPVLEPMHTLWALEHGLPIYRSYFRKKWLRSLRKKADNHPGLIDYDAFYDRKSLTEMSDYFVGAHTPYANSEVYFKGYAVTGERMREIQVETRLVLAEDDPVIPARDLDHLNGNPLLKIVRSPYGGHCGFIENFKMESWADRYIADFLREDAQR
ncbi:YheT family hydrolase [Hahella sp. HN01]|uniref:YheT family hydrolase n=1 Tax=unclassified Hahella TaxID=2624107 RepID=UPI001C1EDAB0|nr:alpha/beta fold hydrolase [Hahella sp. HN01]MBU6950351.1 alpha/beta fold hydrolase [Hahella sp. HN01]